MPKEDLTPWIEKIRNSDKTVKHFPRNQFLKDLKDHQEKLNGLIDSSNLSQDSLGVSGNQLFPLTIDIMNREKMPGEYQWHGAGKTLCVVFYGISPELENFVSLTLWPHELESSDKLNISQQAYRRIYDLIEEDKERRKVIKIEDNYKLNLPNEIRPFRSEITSRNKEKAIYNWAHSPFLKEVGQTILDHKSPLNFTRVFVRDNAGNLNSRYANFKTTVGQLVERRSDVAKFKLIYTKKTRRRFYKLKIGDRKLKEFEKVERGDLLSLLIGEVVNHAPHRILMDFREISSVQVLSHILLFKIYNQFLSRKRLFLMTNEKYREFFKKFSRLTRAYCKNLDVAIGSDAENFFKLRLSPFVRKINGKLFYIPYILDDTSNKNIELIDRKLKENEERLFENKESKGNVKYPKNWKSFLKDSETQQDLNRNLDRMRDLQKKYSYLRFLLKLKNLVYG